MFPEKMRRQNQNADQGGEAGGEHRAEDPHLAGENEHIVQNHVRQAAADHGGHGKLRSAVVAHEAEKEIVQEKRGREEQNDAQIGFGHGEDLFVRAQKRNDAVGKEEAGGCKKEREERGKAKGVGEDPVGRLPVAVMARDRVLDSAAHADHQAASVDEAVNRNRQIQRRQPVHADSLRDEKGVGQNVAGKADHAQDIQGRVLQKILKAVRFCHGFLQKSRKSGQTKKRLLTPSMA